jgi:hypothetical protein
VGKMKPETVIAFGIVSVCVMETVNLLTLGYDGTILSGCVGAITYLCGLLHGKRKSVKKIRRRRKRVYASQTPSFTPYPALQSQA